MTILELQQVSKSFDGTKAVDHVSLGFEQGKVTGLIGPNGAGKTTVFHLINGFLCPDEGDIRYKGKQIDGFRPWQVAVEGIGRLFQDVRVFDRLTALENVLTAFRNQPDDKPWASLIQRRRVIALERENVEKAKQWLQFVGLSEMENVLAEDISYGQQKLLAIARLLAADAETLLLDEPTAGVNPQMVQPLLDLIRKLAREQGKTVVVIEHNMTAILDVADWVYFMDEGQVVSFGLPEDVLGNSEVRRLYIGV